MTHLDIVCLVVWSDASWILWLRPAPLLSGFFLEIDFMADKVGKIIVIHGPMFSGKTTFMIGAAGRPGAVAFKPNIDDRYTNKSVLRSHDGGEVLADVVSPNNPRQILKVVKSLQKKQSIRFVVIDETNFFSKDLIPVVVELKHTGVGVVVGGLLLDSERNDFGATRALIEVADEVKIMTARCDKSGCKKEAIFSYSKKPKKTQLVVGKNELYGASCSDHYDDLHVSGIKKRMGVKEAQLVDYGVYPGYVDWFSKMELPNWRKKPKAKTGRWPRIEIGGESMRVGKSTAKREIARYLSDKGWPVEYHDEDWRNNPHLIASYGDESEKILESQKWFAKRKHEQVSENPKSKVWIQCVNPEMDYSYALTNALLGRMSIRQFEEYRDFYKSLQWEKLQKPDLLVYLGASDDVLVSRAEQSVRDFETVDANYFLVMRSINRRWLSEASDRTKILVVNTDKLDFATDGKAKQQLGEMVEASLKEEGWESRKSVRKNGELKKTEKTATRGDSSKVFDLLGNEKIVIMCGVPGSGKSYFAKKMKKEYGHSYISTDVIRFSKVYENQVKYLDSTDEYVRTRELVYKLLHEGVFRRLRGGKKVVVDATYLGPQREVLLELLEERGVKDQAVFVAVKTDENVIKSRIGNKKLKNGESYLNKWSVAHNWFRDRLSDGRLRYPDEKKDGVRVVEVWNQ
ncbi:AAA family ATPase [Patescibacteria group bacterium]